MLRDFIYVNEGKIDMLAKQINPSLTAEEKGSGEFEGNISFTNPGIKIRETKHRRPLTVSEKINLIEKSLEKQGKLRCGRPTDESDVYFVLEDCEANRVSVPRNNDANIEAFSFWFSYNEHSALCLLEGSEYDVQKGFTKPSDASAYTLLQSLVYYA